MPKPQVRGVWELAMRVEPKNYGLVKAVLIETGLVGVMKEHWVSFPDNYVDPAEAAPAKAASQALPKPPVFRKGAGKLLAVFDALAKIHQGGQTEFNRQDVVKLVSDIEPNYVNSILKKFIDQKMVKRVSQGRYKIIDLSLRSAA